MFSTSIKDILSKFFHLDSLTENLSGYVEARIELLKLEVREEIAKAITRVAVLGVIVLLIVLVIVFLSLGLALFVNQYFETAHAGFFIVGSFYLLLSVLALSLRKQIFQSLERILNEHLKHHKE